MINRIIITCIFLLMTENLISGSRVAFSRPGTMLRIPNMDDSIQKNLFNVGVATEILSSKQFSSAMYINTFLQSGYQYGLTLVKPIEPQNSIEIGMHIQRNMLIYGDINLNIGMQDLLYREGSDLEEANGLDTKGLSLFAVLSSVKNIEDYTVATHLGIGSGKINGDSHLYSQNPNQNAAVFLGFKFTTPFLKKHGGINFLTEWDGKGINLGVNIPIIRSTHINFGITNFGNFGNFATENRSGSEKSNLSGDAPSITFGIGINVPRIISPTKEISELEKPLGDGVYAKTDTSILYYDPICTDVVELLKDSIKVNQYIINNLNDYNHMLQHNEALLMDSTRKNLLKEQVSQMNQNKAMRHLSRSLRFFYNEEYRSALSEVNIAIELNPNLAIAYGRRGSIYFKLGDSRRATLNWNVALQLDPEFTEIYDMLQAAEDNKLKPLEISNKIGENK